MRKLWEKEELLTNEQNLTRNPDEVEEIYLLESYLGRIKRKYIIPYLSLEPKRSIIYDIALMISISSPGLLVSALILNSPEPHIRWAGKITIIMFFILISLMSLLLLIPNDPTNPIALIITDKYLIKTEISEEPIADPYYEEIKLDDIDDIKYNQNSIQISSQGKMFEIDGVTRPIIKKLQDDNMNL